MRFVVLVNPNGSGVAEPMIKEVQSAAAIIGQQIEVLTAGTIREIDTAFTSLVQKRTDALLAGPPIVHHPSRAAHDAGDAPRDAADLSGARACRNRRADELRSERC